MDIKEISPVTVHATHAFQRVDLHVTSLIQNPTLIVLTCPDDARHLN